MGLFGGNSDKWIWIVVIAILIFSCCDGDLFGGGNDSCCDPCDPCCKPKKPDPCCTKPDPCC